MEQLKYCITPNFHGLNFHKIKVIIKFSAIFCRVSMFSKIILELYSNALLVDAYFSKACFFQYSLYIKWKLCHYNRKEAISKNASHYNLMHLHVNKL